MQLLVAVAVALAVAQLSGARRVAKRETHAECLERSCTFYSGCIDSLSQSAYSDEDKHLLCIMDSRGIQVFECGLKETEPHDCPQYPEGDFSID